jgi:multisubunit Na+/H+ antiporter MnhC subunit
MQKRDILVMTAILVGVSIPAVLVTLLVNGTIKFIPGQ